MSDFLSQKAWAGWTDLGSDVSWDNYGGKWGICAPDGSWFVILFDSWENMVGKREAEVGSKYLVEIRQVNLAEISPEHFETLMRSSDIDLRGFWATGKPIESEAAQIMLVEGCVSYGIYALLWDESSNAAPMRLMVKARKIVEEYIRDAKKLDKALDRSVNAIGSTARDFAKGDIEAGLRRYVESGDIGMNPDPKKDLMLKIVGFPKAKG